MVIRYSYLWHKEYQRGAEEGLKNRPCAIVLTTKRSDDEEFVRVLPITHTPPDSESDAVEIPAEVKKRLGLDEARSWILLTESNLFRWPGPDLRAVEHSSPPDIAYGFLPPKLFSRLQSRIVEIIRSGDFSSVKRSE